MRIMTVPAVVDASPETYQAAQGDVQEEAAGEREDEVRVLHLAQQHAQHQAAEGGARRAEVERQRATERHPRVDEDGEVACGAGQARATYSAVG